MNDEYILQYDGKYVIFDRKPDKNDIADAYKEFASWTPVKIQGSYNKDLSNDELLSDAVKIIDLLKAQNKE